MRRGPCALLLCCACSFAAAHPLGNNTVNRQAALTAAGSEIRLDYRVDLAEIPTLVAAQDADTDGDGRTSNEEWRAYAERWADGLSTRLRLEVAGRTLDWQAREAPAWQVEPGAAGLTQLRLHAVLRAGVPAGLHRLRYVDDGPRDAPGWREIWVRAANGAELVDSSAARVDRSDALRRFPPAGASLPDESRAEFTVRCAGAGRAPDTTPAQPAPAAEVDEHGATALFLLGVHHIATGVDHLVFLLGLVLMARAFADLAWTVSAFTLAHSLTLGLAAAGLVRPPGSVVEPAIALTIAYVGWLNVRGRRSGHGLPLAFLFGLVHGFGFAGALAETLGRHGLAGPGWLWDLAAFNLGIESFQLALLALLLPLLARARRWPWAAFARRGAAHGVLWSGLAWFALRAWPA